MIRYDLKTVAAITGGTVIGDESKVIEGAAFDSRTVQNGNLFVPIIGTRVNGHDYVAPLYEKGQIAASLWRRDQENRPEGVDLVVVENVEEAFRALAAAYRRTLQTVIIGITGSSGKTSTKDIISSVLAVKYKVHKTFANQNNELGVPLTVCSIDQDDDYAVIEMGISEIGEMDMLADLVRPDLTVITNIAPAHIMNFHDMDTIVKQKCTINKNLTSGRCYYAVDAYGLDDYIRNYQRDIQRTAYGFGPRATFQVVGFHFEDFGMSFEMADGTTYRLPVLGRHQITNALSAIAIARDIGMSQSEIQLGLDNVTLTPHRLQIRKIGQATIIDDCYNSNPGSLAASLELLTGYQKEVKKAVVLGDMLELGENERELHANVADSVDFGNFQEIYLYGPLMKSLADRLTEEGIECHHYEDRDALKHDLEHLLDTYCIILFKASNGMKFIDLIRDLEANHEN